jgi:eukaryotic-like serine/threonine-protein kinase
MSSTDEELRALSGGAYALRGRVDQSDGIVVWAATDTRDGSACWIERPRGVVDAAPRAGDDADSIAHPNLLRVLSRESDYLGPFVILEAFDGISLGRWCEVLFREGSTPWALLTAIGIEVCRALGALHEASPSVVHGMLSAHTIYLGTAGAVKVGGRGLARSLPRLVAPRLHAIAPEVLAGAPRSVASDLYALGAVLWEAVAGVELFPGKTDLARVLAARRGSPPLLSAIRTDVPASLAEVINRSLASDPGGRPERALTLAKGLAEVLRVENVKHERLGASVRSAKTKLESGV